jgi:hypothetical protein
MPRMSAFSMRSGGHLAGGCGSNRGRLWAKWTAWPLQLYVKGRYAPGIGAYPYWAGAERASHLLNLALNTTPHQARPWTLAVT